MTTVCQRSSSSGISESAFVAAPIFRNAATSAGPPEINTEPAVNSSAVTVSDVRVPVLNSVNCQSITIATTIATHNTEAPMLMARRTEIVAWRRLICASFSSIADGRIAVRRVCDMIYALCLPQNTIRHFRQSAGHEIPTASERRTDFPIHPNLTNGLGNPFYGYFVSCGLHYDNPSRLRTIHSNCRQPKTIHRYFH